MKSDLISVLDRVAPHENLEGYQERAVESITKVVDTHIGAARRMRAEVTSMEKPAITITNPLSMPEREYPDADEDVNPCFHGRQWAAVLNESYGFEPSYIEASRGGVCRGIFPLMTTSGPFGLRKRGVSLPFSDFCEPYAADKFCFEEMFNAAVRLGKSKGWGHIELRGGAGWLPQVSRSGLFYGHVLDIAKDDNRLMAAMNDSTQRNIRNAQRRNVHYTADHNWEATHAFYRLHCRTRKKHGIPPQPIRFFRSLHHHIIDNGKGFIALARCNDRIIAGAVFLLYGERAIFKFGASDERRLDKRANDLVLWEATRDCRERGVKQLYFGRTEPGNLGLRRFKQGFGTREYPISYFRYDINAMKFSTPKPAKEINRHLLSWMPVFLLRVAGEMMYPFIG